MQSELRLILERVAKKDTYTVGKLYIEESDGELRKICDTLEDKDRGLTSRMPIEVLRKQKVFGETAIPVGTYKIDMEQLSPRFGAQPFYKKVCSGKVPRLVDVPGFQGVLIHVGNVAKDTHGCILVGDNLEKGKVLNSKTTFTKVYGILKEAHKEGKSITITIK